MKTNTLALFAFSPAAEARVSSADRNTNSVGAGCGVLQDQWDQGAKDLSNAQTQADYDRIMGAMKTTLGSWNLLCGSYGSIMFRRAPVGSVIGDTTGTNVTGESAGPITAVAPNGGSNTAEPAAP
jgi:hypothetical protein